VIFTGGAGEHQAGLRAMICDSLDALGIQVDQVRNERAFGVEGAITTPGSRTQVWVIPTNEELIIARDTMRVILAKSRPKVRKRAAAKPQM
jgi:acetate kinase